jgi:hypothetical protein
VVVPVGIEWKGPAQFTVNIPAALCWEVNLAKSWSTQMLNAIASLVPDAWWQKTSTLRAMGLVVRFALRTGKLNLTGKTPNGQGFIANPKKIWLIDSSHAALNGLDLGPVGPLGRQARLSEFMIPQRGLFEVAHGFMHSPAMNPLVGN